MCGGMGCGDRVTSGDMGWGHREGAAGGGEWGHVVGEGT